MPNYDQLRENWLAAGPISVKEKLAAINALRVPSGPVDISTAALRAVLEQQGKLAVLELYASAIETKHLRERLGQVALPPGIIAANYLLAMLNESDTLRVHQLPVFKRLLADVAADPCSGITQTDVETLSAPPVIAWWQMAGFGKPVSMLDLMTAGIS
jgi:hypothetical protein